MTFTVWVHSRTQRDSIIHYFTQTPVPTDRSWHDVHDDIMELVPSCGLSISDCGPGYGVTLHWHPSIGAEGNTADVGAGGNSDMVDPRWGNYLQQMARDVIAFNDRVWAHFAAAPKGTVTGAMLLEARNIELAKDRAQGI